MGKIIVLPETVQNQIAAGEVIERPASVVKELAENALDAGATLIAVDLEEGGHRLIRVSDNGSGMDEADLIASLQRHATSKIRKVEDIFGIATFGFRGEALPSIGSVSRLNIATCQPDEKEGREIMVEGGRILRLSPAPPRKGTRIEVRDIFYNTPARRKFLRQPASESTRTGEVLTRLALGNPGVGFRLQVGDRMAMAVQPAESQLARVGDLFGRETAGRLAAFSGEIAPGLAVSGFFAKPPRSCRNSRDIYVLVNRRWIRYFALARAVGDAFQGVLPPRSYPFAVINLDVDPARVDLNVHPAKEEVRFEQENLLIAGVRQAIRRSLDELALTSTFISAASPSGSGSEAAAATATGDSLSGIAPGSISSTAPGVANASAPGAVVPNGKREEKPRNHYSSFSPNAFSPPDGEKQGRFPLASSFAAPRNHLEAADLATARERLKGRENASPHSNENRTAAERNADASPETPERESVAASANASAAGATLSVGLAGQHRVLGQAGGKYILVDGPDGLLLIDPHALHERWNFDRLTEERQRGAAARTLLLPLELRLSPAEAAAAPETLPLLAEYGFELRLPEPSRLVVEAAPAFLPPSTLENLLRQVLADSGEIGVALEAARERVLASLACRSSVLLGRTLPEGEMLALLDRFFNQGQLPTCPHGRPTAIRIGWEELASRFGR